MKHISQPHPMLDAGEKVSGRLVYLDDMQIDGLLHARLVWSPLPHARILRIDTEAARRVPLVPRPAGPPSSGARCAAGP